MRFQTSVVSSSAQLVGSEILCDCFGFSFGATIDNCLRTPRAFSANWCQCCTHESLFILFAFLFLLWSTRNTQTNLENSLGPSKLVFGGLETVSRGHAHAAARLRHSSRGLAFKPKEVEWSGVEHRRRMKQHNVTCWMVTGSSLFK